MDRVEEIRGQLNNTPILDKEDAQYLLVTIDQLREEKEELKKKLTAELKRSHIFVKFYGPDKNPYDFSKYQKLQSQLDQLRASQKPLLEAVEFRLIKGHNDTCSHELNPNYTCTCGHDNLKEVAERVRPVRGTEEKEHIHKWENINGLPICKCGSVFSPPRPKGDNPKG